MRKRTFLAATLAASALPAIAQPSAGTKARGPALLTLTGAIGAPNRPAFDPAADVLMGKHGVSFSAAHAFDWMALAALPARTIAPTLEYDAKPHRLTGPSLVDVLAAAGVPRDATATLAMRAIDGYAPTVSLEEARRLGFIVAMYRDDRPLPLGGLGPLWAVYDADRVPEMASKPLGERFARCPWGLYHVAVKA